MTKIQSISRSPLRLPSVRQGRPSPWGNDGDAFPPISDSLCFRKISWLRGKFPSFYLFPKNFSIFIRQNFWWLFFSLQPQISNFPPLSIHFPLFRQSYSFRPTFQNFPLFSANLRAFYIYFLCFSFPPTFTMMHLCITQCTYWTPLLLGTALRHLSFPRPFL